MRFLKKIQVTALQGDPSAKALEVLRYYLMKEEAKKWSFIKRIEDYAEEKKLDNEYMVKFARKLEWLSGVLLEKFLPEDDTDSGNEEE